MTTITWDLKTLSADTLVSDSAAIEKTGFFTQRGWSVRSKLWVPAKPVTYERSPIIAVGASGNVLVGNLITDFLLDRNLEANTRPTTLLRADLRAQATVILAAHQHDASLLILTESKCWRLKAEPGKAITITDVTSRPTAIGAGAHHAQPCLDAGQSGIRGIIEAARHPASESNFNIEYVKRSSTPRVTRAWQSFTTLKDPLRLNRVITRCIAVIGGALTAAGGIALQAGGYSGTAQMLLVALAMVGMVASVSSVLTSLQGARALSLHLVPIVLLLLLLSWGTSARFLEAHNLIPLCLLYIGSVLGLAFIGINWPKVRAPLNAVHVGAGLTLVSLLAAVIVFGPAPCNWWLVFAGVLGVLLGYAATLRTVKQMVQIYARNQVIIERC